MNTKQPASIPFSPLLKYQQLYSLFLLLLLLPKGKEKLHRPEESPFDKMIDRFCIVIAEPDWFPEKEELYKKYFGVRSKKL